MNKPNAPTRITLDVLPEGMVRITSTCMGRPDASYPPMTDGGIALEVQKLLDELRHRLAGVNQ